MTDETPPEKIIERLENGIDEAVEEREKDAHQSEAYPDSPISYVEIHHKDGTIKNLSGEEARAWTSWVDGGVGMAVSHGMEPPEIEWNVTKNGENDE